MLTGAVWIVTVLACLREFLHRAGGTALRGSDEAVPDGAAAHEAWGVVGPEREKEGAPACVHHYPGARSTERIVHIYGVVAGAFSIELTLSAAAELSSRGCLSCGCPTRQQQQEQRF